MADKRYVHGREVHFEDDAAHSGVRHLEHHLSKEEAEVFFHEAKRRGKAEFEDQEGRNYTLVRRDGTYHVERR